MRSSDAFAGANMTSLYERMKLRGVNMSWYEKGKRGRRSNAIPLDDEECSNQSVYLLKEDGTLWTIDTKGVPHNQVRPSKKQLPRSVYVCLHCGRQWNEAPIGKKSKVIEHGPGVKSA